ncbi:hypothetical protein BD289DRAFT_291011 [Coniella lustricola]|uniref:Uncharacterized protein n=1 Tax=Coniella lustricola TaxID=2025994 RepID=A0A2T3A5E2_9PEZI|nr:hypothetical protein BD289DRAFT_291011 [Coniella lustricola]
MINVKRAALPLPFPTISYSLLRLPHLPIGERTHHKQYESVPSLGSSEVLRRLSPGGHIRACRTPQRVDLEIVKLSNLFDFFIVDVFIVTTCYAMPHPPSLGFGDRIQRQGQRVILPDSPFPKIDTQNKNAIKRLVTKSPPPLNNRLHHDFPSPVPFQKPTLRIPGHESDRVKRPVTRFLPYNAGTVNAERERNKERSKKLQKNCSRLLPQRERKER